MLTATSPRRAVPRPPAAAGFRLRGRAHRTALWAHILTSAAWFGVAVMVAFCGLAATVTDDAGLSHALYRTMETAPWLSIPVGLTAIVSGVVLSLGTRFGLVRHWWVVAKIVIAALVVGRGWWAKRACWRWRAWATRARICSDFSPAGVCDDSSRNSTSGTSTWRSMRSSKGPEMRWR